MTRGPRRATGGSTGILSGARPGSSKNRPRRPPRGRQNPHELTDETARMKIARIPPSHRLLRPVLADQPDLGDLAPASAAADAFLLRPLERQSAGRGRFLGDVELELLARPAGVVVDGELVVRG